jgi:hypothetical protein
LGPAQPSLLRPSILLAGAATLGSCLLAIPAPARAGGLAPDPAPSADVRPDAYPAPPAPEIVVEPAAPTTVTKVVVIRPPTTHRAAPPKPHRPAARAHPRATPKPQRRLPFPTLAIKWFSGTAVSAAGRSRDVPARTALVLAALVLASALLVAGAAREAAR